jgi:hypothetical protein
MIRAIIIFFLLSSLYQRCLSQEAETFIDSLPYVCEMFIYEDDLYFTSTEIIDDFNNTGRLFKVNLLSDEIVLDTILEFPDVITGLYIKDDFIYYNLWPKFDVFRLGLNDIIGIPDTIFSDLYLMGDIEIIGSDLYVIATRDPNFEPNVYKYDLDSMDKEPIRYFEGFWPLRIHHHEDHLYITTRFSDLNIQRIDLSVVDGEVEVFVDSLFGPTALIAIEDNLYFADDLNQGTNRGRVIKVNLNGPDRELTPFTEVFFGAHEIVYYDGYFYVSEVLGDKISRFKLPITTNLDPISNVEVSIYPNPVSDILNIQGKVEGEYNIYSMDGKKMSSGKLNSASEIDVKDFPTGTYVISFKSGEFGKFQKIGD